MGQQNGGAVVAEVRPLAVCGSRTDSYCAKGGVANDVGGGGFLVYVDKHHVHQYLRNVQSEVRAAGPVLSEAVYSGTTLDGAIDSEVEVSLAQTDAFLKTVHRFRYTVRAGGVTGAARLAFYSVGADQGDPTSFAGLAHGVPGTRTPTLVPGTVFDGAAPAGYHANFTRRACASGGSGSPGAWGHCWFYLASEPKSQGVLGAFADRGLVVRHWDAVLGGKRVAQPHWSLHSTSATQHSLELSPPPGVDTLLDGDYVEAVVELLTLPQRARDYYGPNNR